MKRSRPLWILTLLIALATMPALAQERGDYRVTIDVTAYDFEPTEPLLDAMDSFELIELFATGAREDAARLKSFLRQPTAHSWESHAATLETLRTEVNNIAGQLERLETIADMDVTLLPRQELALSEIRVDAVVLAASTRNAIEYLNSNEGTRWNQDYQNFADEIYERADEVAQAAKMAESRLNVQEYLENSED